MKAWKLPVVAAAAFCSGAYAVEPEGIRAGSGVTLLPTVDLTISDDNNIYSQDADTTSSLVTRFKPGLGIKADLGATELTALYRVEMGQYNEDDNDDYTDQLFSVGARSELNARHELAFAAKLNQAHDARGAGTVEGSAALTVEDPDEFDETSADINYIYGSDTSFLNLDTYAGYYKKEYQNNEQFGTADRNHDKTKIGALLSLNVSSATKALLEVRSTDIAYDEDSAIAKGREGNELKILAGASWDVTGKTTGSVKVGSAARSFDDSDVDSNTRLSWEASVVYAPRTYSTLTLLSSQNSNETNGAGSYIASDYTAFGWTHTFSPFVSAMLDVSLAKDTYVDDAAGRHDEILGYGVTGIFSPTKIIDVKASYKMTNRDSNIDGLDYDRDIISLGFALAI